MAGRRSNATRRGIRIDPGRDTAAENSRIAKSPERRSAFAFMKSLLLLLSTWLLSLLAVPTVAQTRAAKAPSAVVDQLPVGRVWRGTDDSGAAMTISVVARNVAGKTARLRVKANNGWTFEVDVITENGGSKFRVSNARRVDQRVRITREGGGGRASKTEIAFGLTWTYDRGHRHGQNEKKIQARR